MYQQKKNFYNLEYSPLYTAEEDYIDYLTIVRNPFDLLTSYYFHSKGANHKGWANCLNIHNINDFENPI